MNKLTSCEADAASKREYDRKKQCGIVSVESTSTSYLLISHGSDNVEDRPGQRTRLFVSIEETRTSLKHVQHDFDSSSRQTKRRVARPLFKKLVGFLE